MGLEVIVVRYERGLAYSGLGTKWQGNQGKLERTQLDRKLESTKIEWFGQLLSGGSVWCSNGNLGGYWADMLVILLLMSSLANSIQKKKQKRERKKKKKKEGKREQKKRLKQKKKDKKKKRRNPPDASRSS